MKIILTNAFSLNMLDDDCQLDIFTLNIDQVKLILKQIPWESAIGHADTAAMVGNLLGIDIPCNRVTITMEQGNPIIVAQYVGPRLPEGTTVLPEGSNIIFKRVEKFYV
jgi:hypothetical protein